MAAIEQRQPAPVAERETEPQQNEFTKKVQAVALAILSVVFGTTGALLIGSLFFTSCGIVGGILRLFFAFCFMGASESTLKMIREEQ